MFSGRAEGANPSVSPNNPCPFLRAIVADGLISPHLESISKVGDIVAAAGQGTPADKQEARRSTYLIGLVANGLRPDQLVKNMRRGLRVDALRGGPLDKRGAGSRILTRSGEIDEQQLDRLDEFASDVTSPEGGTERGLGAAQIERMMDANFARAEGSRRRSDRRLMEYEWPVLLRVMGKGRGNASYLSLSEVRALFVERRLPERIRARIKT